MIAMFAMVSSVLFFGVGVGLLPGLLTLIGFSPGPFLRIGGRSGARGRHCPSLSRSVTQPPQVKMPVDRDRNFLQLSPRGSNTHRGRLPVYPGARDAKKRS